jgi:hypothetical protein
VSWTITLSPARIASIGRGPSIVRTAVPAPKQAWPGKILDMVTTESKVGFVLVEARNA